MAIIYVYDGAGGAANGTSWTDAYSQLQPALTAWTISDIIHVAVDHDEFSIKGSGNWSYTCGNASSIDRCIIRSVNRGTDVYEVNHTTAQFICVGNLSINFEYDIWGLFFSTSGVYSFNGIEDGTKMAKDCKFEWTATSGNQYLAVYGDADFGAIFDFRNCTFVGSSGAGYYFYLINGANINFVGGDISFGAIPTTGLIRIDQGGAANLLGVDLSGTTFSSAPLGYFASSKGHAETVLVNCKIPSGINMVNGNNEAQFVELIGTDNSTNSDRYERHNGKGAAIVTSTSVYRDSGYTGADSGNQISHKIAPVSSTSYEESIQGIQMIGVVEATGSKTFKVQVAHNFTTALKDIDAFIELVYLGGSDTLGTLETSSPQVTNSEYDPLAAGATLATSTEVWTGAGSLTKQEISLTKTVNKVGIYMVRVIFTNYESGKVCYYDPHVDVS